MRIEPPELENLRRAPHEQSGADTRDLPEEVAFFHCQAHSLQPCASRSGALRRVVSEFASSPAVRSPWISRRKRCAICCAAGSPRHDRDIQKTVAEYYKIRVADLLSKRSQSLDRAAAAGCDGIVEGDHESSLRRSAMLSVGRDHNDSAARLPRDQGSCGSSNTRTSEDTQPVENLAGGTVDDCAWPEDGSIHKKLTA